MAGACGDACRGACLHQIEFIPRAEDGAATAAERPSTDAAEEEIGFCDFVCQFVSLDCPNTDKCTEVPCANYALCGNTAPQWLLDTRGGLCLQPCDMFYGVAFEFSSFAADEACPLCLETGVVSMVFACAHMICARCFERSAFNEAATQALKRCPVCRRQCRLRARAVTHPSLFA